MYPALNLTLVVNHACNLRCRYCYTGAKVHRSMPHAVGYRSIDRGLASLEAGGTLELDFFGGEPLLEAYLIHDLIAYSHQRSASAGMHLRLGMTTNGTAQDEAAWRIMLRPDLALHISYDGLPAVHDRHRVDRRGLGTSNVVLNTIERLVAADVEVRVVMVVRPDTAQFMAGGLQHLHSKGVRHVTPSLDVWSAWSRKQARELANAIARAADIWSQALPELSVSWFDEKAAQITDLPVASCTGRCGFGDGQVAVAPSGNLYPCERLVGADLPSNTARLPGTALVGDDFLDLLSPDGPIHSDCAGCALQPQCSTSCRCSNFIRTGDVRRPDGLLCLLDQTCYQETLRVIEQRAHMSSQIVPV